MIKSSETVNALSKIFCEATKEVVEAATGVEVNYSKTMQKVGIVHLRPDIGCFVLFSGDYSGLLIMNFSGSSALAIYRHSLLKMGFPEEELAQDFTSEDVVNSIGETINQIIGKVRRQVEHQYGLVARNTQPRAIALSNSIVLTVDAHDVSEELCRRLTFKIEGQSFQIELALEKTEFISMDGGDTHGGKEKLTHNVNLEDYQEQAAAPEAQAEPAQPDFDALMKMQGG